VRGRPRPWRPWQSTSVTTFRLLVLAVVTRVCEVAQGWTQPWYVDCTRLGLSDAPEGVGKMHDAERDPGHYIDLTEHGDVMGDLPLSKLPVRREEYDTILRAKGFTQCKAGLSSLLNHRWLAADAVASVA
jgi:hypothetical protein